MGTVHAVALETEDPYPLVLVTWRDAHFEFDQATAETGWADYLVRTAGFLLADGPRFVSIAQEVLPHGEGFRAVTHVPCGVVERIEPLAAVPAAPIDPVAPVVYAAPPAAHRAARRSKEG